jgi:tetratricopeptide (TPR) repeat protein
MDHKIEIQNLIREADEAYAAKKFPQVEALCKKVLERCGERQEQEPYANALYKLASVHFVQNKFGDAAAEYDRAFSIQQAVKPDDQPLLANINYWAGEAHFKNQAYEIAETRFREAIRLAQGATKPDAQKLADYIYQLGFLLYFVGRYQEADGVLMDAVGRYDALYGPNHTDTAGTYERLALTYENCPELQKNPAPLFEKALEGYKAVSPQGYCYVACLARYASYLHEVKRDDQAEPLYAEMPALLAGLGQEYGFELSWIESGYIKFLRDMGKAEEAESLEKNRVQPNDYLQMVKEKAELFEQTLSPEDPAFAESLVNLANALLFKGDLAESETHLRRALSLQEQFTPEDSEKLAVTLLQLSKVLRAKNDLAAAEAALQRAIELVRKSGGEKPSQILPRLVEGLAILKAQQNSASDVVVLCAESTALYESIHGLLSYECLEGHWRAAQCLTMVKDLQRAEDSIKVVMDNMDKVEMISGYEKHDYMHVFAHVLEETGRAEQANAIRSRADELLKEARANDGDED